MASMKLEYIMVQMESTNWKTNGIQSHLHVLSKNTELTEAGTEWQLLGTRNCGKCGDLGQTVKKNSPLKVANILEAD